jgi:predicted Zn finger-like uncharacterized protein
MLITCSNCQSKIRVPDSAAGKKGKCPKCGTVITIPLEEPPAEAAIAEPAPVEEAPPAPVAEQPADSPFDFSEPEPPPPPRRTSRKAVDEEDEVMEEPAEAEVEEEEEAPKKKKLAKENTTLSLVSMILGIVSVFCSCISLSSWCVAPIPFLCAVGALVTGFLGLKQGGKGMAITGMCCGGGSILLTIGLTVASFFLGAILQAVGIGR